MLTEAQKRAKKKYRDKNKDRTNYITCRSAAKSFIKNKATREDLEEIKKLIQEVEAVKSMDQQKAGELY